MNTALYPGSQITAGEGRPIIMGHVLRHHESKEATESLLKVIEAHLPESATLPSSKYLFSKEFAGSKAVITQHLYCPGCFSY